MSNGAFALPTGAKSTPSPESPVHERVYQALRERILYGGFQPGRPVTLRGLADSLGVSPMPVREAVRRLIAVRALELHDNRRVSVPAMTARKFDEIVFARLALEPELAVRALPRMGEAEIGQIERIDDQIEVSMQSGDPEGYMRYNHAFHSAIYGRAGSETLGALVDSIWLQFGPFMRTVYGRVGTSSLEDQHQRAITAIRQRDADRFKQAIAEDIMQGMRFIGESAFQR
ncbi:MAG: GntR family transcriptional regulator [Hyphomicrobiaceae bacterium]